MSIGAAITGPFDRPAESGTRSSVRHAAALVAVAGAVAVLELGILDLDHGTHLLVVLTLVIGIAVLSGPGPATTALIAGGAVATAGYVITVDRAFDTPLAYVQLLAYLVTGTAFIVLLARAVRSRQRPPNPTTARMTAPAGQPGLVEPLTARETEVLRLSATGVSVEEMARRLFVSRNTVKTHLTHIYAKLGVRGRPDAIRAAIHFGYLTTTDICPHHHADGVPESPVPVTTSGAAPTTM